MMSESRLPEPDSNPSFAAAIASRSWGKRQARSFSMPVYWEPCPGKSMPRRPGSMPQAKKAPSGVCQADCEFFASIARAFFQSAARLVLFRSITRIRRQAALGSKPAREAAARSRKAFQELSGCIRSNPAASAAASAPESATIWVLPSQSAAFLAGWYSSKTTWKFEPPKPKALTPARRGMPARGNQGRFWAAM